MVLIGTLFWVCYIIVVSSATLCTVPPGHADAQPFMSSKVAVGTLMHLARPDTPTWVYTTVATLVGVPSNYYTDKSCISRLGGHTTTGDRWGTLLEPHRSTHGGMKDIPFCCLYS
jgi:hypothetical protein